MLSSWCVSWWDVHVPCAWTHVSSYATDAFLAGMFTFLAHEHVFAAKQLLRFLLVCSRSLHMKHMLNATQMLRFLLACSRYTCWMLRNCCVSCWYVDVPCTWTHVECYATAAFLAGMFTFLAHEHMLNATQLLRFLVVCSRSLHMNTCWMLRNYCVSCWYVHVPCTWTHVECYATAAFLAGMFTFLAHEHMLNATQLLRFLLVCSRSLHMNTCWMLRNCCVSCWYVHVPCTWTHVECYATTAFLAGMLTFLAHEHMLNATQLLRFLLVCWRSLHMNTCWMLRNCCVSCWYVHVPCTWTHVECYATAAFLLVCSRSLHMNTCWMLRNCSGMFTFLAHEHMLNATQLLCFRHGMPIWDSKMWCTAKCSSAPWPVAVVRDAPIFLLYWEFFGNPDPKNQWIHNSKAFGPAWAAAETLRAQETPKSW